MVDPSASADAVLRRKIFAPAGNRNPIPSRTASSLVTILTELSWFFRLLCNVCELSHVKTMRIPEDCKIILLTYSMVQSPPWEANWFAASQEIPRISRNPKVHYRTHKRPPPVCIQGQLKPVHMPTSHLLEIRPNIISPSTPRSPQWSLSLRFPHQIIYRPKKAKNFSRQLIRFKLADWGPHRSTAMAHLPELSQCLDSHPRNLLSLMKLPAVIYQKVFLCWADTPRLTANQTSNSSDSTFYPPFFHFQRFSFVCKAVWVYIH